jgi:hypothetical protein
MELKKFESYNSAENFFAAHGYNRAFLAIIDLLQDEYKQFYLSRRQKSTYEKALEKFVQFWNEILENNDNTKPKLKDYKVSYVLIRYLIDELKNA